MSRNWRLSKGMSVALIEARDAGRRGEVPVGACVIASNGNVLARSGNRTIELHDPTAHAEILVLRAAAKKLGSERLVDCDLYVTLEPCAMCAGAATHARVRRVYFGAEDEKMGAVENGPRLFFQPNCHHRPEIYGGIASAEATDMLRDFFSSKRKS